MTEAELAAIGAAILATDEVLGVVEQQISERSDVLDQIRLAMVMVMVSGRQFLADTKELLKSLERAKGEA